MSQLSFSLVEEMGDPTWGVSELNAEIGRVVRRAFSDEVWVRGEVRGLKRSSAGHVYFTLVERGEEGDATLQVNLFARARQAVDHMLMRARMRLEDGIEVRIHGLVEFYGARGQINLRMGRIDPTYTLGRMAADRDAVIARLVGEGLVGRNKQRPFPLAPVRIGLVTSVGSAAFHDFTHELSASGLGFTVVTADARVQGMDAPAQLTRAVVALARSGVDVICVVRGGGAKTDLVAFDDETLARAIAGAPVPVLTGIGHETDSSIADLVAHRAWKTPTACAGSLVEQVRTYCDRVDTAWAGIADRSRQLLVWHGDRLDTSARRVARDVGAALGHAEQRTDFHARRLARETTVAVAGSTDQLDRSVQRIGQAARRILATGASGTDTAERRLVRAAPRPVDAAHLALESLAARIGALNPARLLARGWSITHTADGVLVREPRQAPAGTTLVTSLAGGEVTSTVGAPGSPP